MPKVVKVKSYPYCFGCGDENPVGLRLKFQRDGDFLISEFVPREVHEGWPKILHGGIITSLLYEIMENFPYQTEGLAVMMRDMDTRFRRPGRTDSMIIAKSWLTERNGRQLKVAGSLTDKNEKLIAEGNADLVILRREQREKLGL